MERRVLGKQDDLLCVDTELLQNPEASPINNADIIESDENNRIIIFPPTPVLFIDKWRGSTKYSSLPASS